MNKHTPGPWSVRHRHVSHTEHDDEVHGCGLEIVGPPEATNRGQFARAADARLIATAPDLLAACEAMADALDLVAADQSHADDPRCGLVQPIDVDEGNQINAAIAQGRAAFAKATRDADDPTTE